VTTVIPGSVLQLHALMPVQLPNVDGFVGSHPGGKGHPPGNTGSEPALQVVPGTITPLHLPTASTGGGASEATRQIRAQYARASI
jgi:hypothetical protein